jgi:D-alanine-D-alanine ligase
MTIGVLAGGHSPEREVSLRSGQRVRSALSEHQIEAILIDPAEQPLVERLSSGDIEAVYIALHGKEGEDGTVQRLLELVGIPYTGTGPFACQVSFDKTLAKEALAQAGIATPEWAVIQADTLKDLSGGAILGKVAERVGFPAAVKPARAGSAMGLTFVEREADLPAAVMAALSFSDAAIVERRIIGTEVGASFSGLPMKALPLVEVVPKSGVYDYASRYTTGATEYFAPARLDTVVERSCLAQARLAIESLGLRDVARADVVIDETGKPWILEVNTSPGMTETSLLPMAAQAAGVSISELCERILQLARNRT